MAYSEALAGRIREVLGPLPGMVEKKMFGGVGFLVNGNMACGVNGEDLIVRVGPEGHAEALSWPHARPFDMTGRPMSGWVVVAPPAFTGEDDLRALVQRGVAFAQTLPPK